jgi:hypothetical protein
MVLIDISGLSAMQGKTGETEFQRECLRRAMKGFFSKVLGALCIDVAVDFIEDATGQYHNTCVVLVYVSLLGADKNDSVGESVLCSEVTQKIQGHIPNKMPYTYYVPSQVM